MSEQKDQRVYNFSAGPGTLPLSVLQTAQREFLNFGGDTGMNIMEQSHRDADGPVQTMMQQAVDRTKELLSIPANYQVLYMHGGAHAQFAALPLNLRGSKSKKDTPADYIITGYWSNRASEEAAKFVNVRKIDAISTNEKGKTIISDSKTWEVNPEAAFVFVCGNETIDGGEFLDDAFIDALPKNVPVVGDFTSTLFSRKIDVAKYGIIFASAGKNLGPSGVAMVIIRDDLVQVGDVSSIPSIMSYELHASSKPIMSIYNTPATFPLYMHNLVLDFIQQKGGVDAAEKRSIERAEKIYAIVDASNGYYVNDVDVRFRSRMNVPMRIGDKRRDLEDIFVADAKQQGMVQLFGHPVSGGLRVTMYVGLPDDAVDKVCAFMKEFQQQHPL